MRSWRLGLMVLGLLVAHAARAQEPAPTPGAAATVPPGAATVVRAPSHRNGPIGFVSTFGATCMNMLSPGNGCFASLRVGFEFIYGEVHLGMVAAQSNGVSTDPADLGVSNRNLGGDFGGARIGIQLGVDLGTRYYAIARSHTTRLFIAGRASLDHDLLFYAADAGGAKYAGSPFAFVTTNTYGPNLSLRIGKHAFAYARLAAGLGLVNMTTPTFAVDGYAGFQLLY